MPRPLTLALAMVLACGVSAPAMAEAKSDTRLVGCGSESCLLVTGRRHDAHSPVSINGHAVPVEGARRWRVVLPVATVREWSAPFARSITVAVDNATKQASLPIGLLGHADDLAMLVVRVR